MITWKVLFENAKVIAMKDSEGLNADTCVSGGGVRPGTYVHCAFQSMTDSPSFTRPWKKNFAKEIVRQLSGQEAQ